MVCECNLAIIRIQPEVGVNLGLGLDQPFRSINLAREGLRSWPVDTIRPFVACFATGRTAAREPGRTGACPPSRSPPATADRDRLDRPCRAGQDAGHLGSPASWYSSYRRGSTVITRAPGRVAFGCSGGIQISIVVHSSSGLWTVKDGGFCRRASPCVLP